jgi:hypothetical protein
VQGEIIMRRRIDAGSRFGALAVAATTTALIAAMTAASAQQPPQQPPPQQPPQQTPTQPPDQPQGRGGRGGRGGGDAAQGRGEAGRGAPAKPLVPLAASTLAANPAQYYGEYVTVTGTIEQSVSPLAFSIDQDKTKSTGKEVLVIPRRLNSPIDPNTYVTVIGDVVKFEELEAQAKAKNFTLNLPADAASKYADKPVILATAVINAGMTDLAKFNPPPMTPEEAMLDKTMKTVGPTNAALRKALEGSNADQVKQNTQILIKAFTDVEAFWKARGKMDAVKFAQEARKASELAELAAVAGKWEEVKSHANTLGQQCSSCHGIYRERGEDGSFYIKPGSSR